MATNDPQAAIDALCALRSVRDLRPDPLAAAEIDGLVRVARWTGSAKNVQAWEFLTIQDRATLDALAPLGGYTRHLAHAALGFAVILPNEEPMTEAFDEGRVVERVQLAAQAYGLGSCIAWFDEDDGSSLAAKRLLGIPEARTLRTILSVGTHDPATHVGWAKPGQARKPLSELLSLERYGRHPEAS